MQCGKLAWPMLSRSLHSYSHLLDCGYKVNKNILHHQIFLQEFSNYFSIYPQIAIFARLNLDFI